MTYLGERDSVVRFIYYKNLFAKANYSNLSFDYIFHIARSGNNPKKVMKYDILFSEKLFSVFRNTPVIYFSSQRILDDEENDLYEHSNYYVENYYDLGKVSGELFLKSKNRNPFSKIIRIPILTGRNHSMFRTDQVLYSIISHIYKGGNLCFGNSSDLSGSSWIDSDAVAILLFSKDFAFLKKEEPRVINLSSGWFRFSELCSYIIKKSGSQSQLLEGSDSFGSMNLPQSSYYLKDELFRREFSDYQINSDIYKSVDEMIVDLERFDQKGKKGWRFSQPSNCKSRETNL